MIVNTFLFKKSSRSELNEFGNENEARLKSDTEIINLKRDDEMNKTKKNVETNL